MTENDTATNRREFLALLGKWGIAAAGVPMVLSGQSGWAAYSRGANVRSAEASYYEKLPGNAVRCLLCPLREVLKPGQTGRCRVRFNRGGRMMTYAAGRPCVLNVDPIEKNPLSHVLPGGRVLSIAHAGCNVECLYCQNWEIALRSPHQTRKVDFDQPQAIASSKEKKLAGVSFSYTEPTMHIEFNMKLAEAVRRAGMRAFLCTNGFVSEGPLRDYLKVLDAVTVTLKGFSDAFYRRYIGVAGLKTVLRSCEIVRSEGKWLEVATLVIPGVNDGDAELRKIARWMVAHLGKDTPWHIERFSPAYRMKNLPPTPMKTLERAAQIGRAMGLRYVYISNVPLHQGNNTFCPKCRRPIIKRVGFKVLSNRLVNGRCPDCSTKVAGIWS